MCARVGAPDTGEGGGMADPSRARPLCRRRRPHAPSASRGTRSRPTRSEAQVRDRRKCRRVGGVHHGIGAISCASPRRVGADPTLLPPPLRAPRAMPHAAWRVRRAWRAKIARPHPRSQRAARALGVCAERAWGCEARASVAASRVLSGRDRVGWLVRRVPDVYAAGGGLGRPRRAAVRDLGRLDPRWRGVLGGDGVQMVGLVGTR